MQSDISKLKNKADASDSDAAFAIFDAYENAKIDTEAAWEAAMYYLNLAVEKENPDALLAMGRLLISGTKIDKDVDKGMALLQRAKELGNKDVDDVASALEVVLDEPDEDQTEHDNSQPETEDTDADDKADAQSADNPDISDDDDSGDDDDDDENSQPAAEPEKAEKENKRKADIGKSDDALTSDQLMRMIKTKLAHLEKSEAMSAAHHFDILKITIDDSENIKELQAIYDVLDKPAYIKTLQGQNQPIIGWNPKQGIFYFDTSARDDAVSDEAPLPKRSYQRGEVRNLIFAVFITIVVLIIFLNLLYAVRPL
ncbi:MAG: hypothetical protein ACPHOL_09370 [Candidatus Puniceispirillum sp.]